MKLLFEQQADIERSFHGKVRIQIPEKFSGSRTRRNGQTSLCESLLFVSGKSERLGRVDDSTSCMDFEPEEQKRRVSISSAANFVEWEKHKINFIDTPGDSNFAYDIKCSMSIVENAVIIVDAVGGVEFQTQKVWELADEFKLPRIIFINRLDRERSNYTTALESIKSKFKKK